MRAVIAQKHGGPDVLTVVQRDAPAPGPGQLLVDVAAAGVNFADIYRREGRPPYGGDVPYVPGMEGAGTVAAAGPGADGPGVGDRVAWTGAASYAEQVIVPAGQAVPVPDDVDLEVAAAGGVGLLLTQMGAARGGVVIATTSSPEKAELAREAGARHLADYGTFGAVTREVTGGAGAAAVYDGVGQATFDASLAALRPRGYMVLYGAASGPVPPLDPQRLAAGGSLFLTRPTLGSYIATPDELRHRADDLFRWIREGTLTVRIGGRYPLDQAARAHEDLAGRRTTGSLILRVR